MITLYDFELSGNCYKVRLMLGFLGLSYETVAVDLHPGRAHKAEWFLDINPLGELPVLVDADVVVRDSQAILVYLATKYDPDHRWLPLHDPLQLARISEWHDVATRLTATASVARTGMSMDTSADIEAAQRDAHRLFRILDEHLWFAERQGQDWLCTEDHPSTADVACFPFVALSEEGGISRQDYPAIRRWLDRVRRVPGFHVMSGIFPAGPSAA